jgi:hypothetical protein
MSFAIAGRSKATSNASRTSVGRRNTGNRGCSKRPKKEVLRMATEIIERGRWL